VKVAGEVELGAFCHEGEDGRGSVGAFVEPLGPAADGGVSDGGTTGGDGPGAAVGG
jgi:hypothetical protein